MKSLAALAALAMLIAAAALMQVRVVCDRLSVDATTERTLRTTLQQSQQRISFALARVAVARTPDALAASRMALEQSGSPAQPVVQSAEAVVVARQKQDEAVLNLAQEIDLAARQIPANSSLAPLTQLLQERQRWKSVLVRLRQIAAAASGSVSSEKEHGLATALASAQQALADAATQAATAIAEARQRQESEMRQILLLVLAAAIFGFAAVVLFLSAVRLLARQHQSEIAVLEELHQDATERLQGVLSRIGGMAEVVRQVATGLNIPARQPVPVSEPEASRHVAEVDTEALNEILHAAAASVVHLQNSGAEIHRTAERIRGIAFKTNILALNAAIEAAHAGEIGAGFGIVAGEVKSLASGATESAEQIADAVKGVEAQTASLRRLLSGASAILEKHPQPATRKPVAVMPAPEFSHPTLTAEREQLVALAAALDGTALDETASFPKPVPIHAVPEPVPGPVPEPVPEPTVIRKPRARKAAAGGR